MMEKKSSLGSKKVVLIELSPIVPNLGKSIVMPRYGLLTIGSILKKETNYDVTLLFEPYVGTIDIDRIISENPSYILLNGLTTTAPQNENLVSQLRKRIKHPFFVIAGGEHATMFPEHTQRYADFVLLYEGDETLLHLLSALEEDNPTKRNNRLAKISGLLYKDSAGVWQQNDEVQRVKNIDYRYDFRIVATARNVHSSFPLMQLPLQTSRGCKYNCSFCSWISLFGKVGYYIRPIEDVIYDINNAMRYTGIQSFMVVDNLFAGDKEYTEELLHQIASTFENQSLKPKFTVLCRADQFSGDSSGLSGKFLELMVKAGVTQVSLGLESVNNQTLDKMRKDSNIALYKRAANYLHKYGINISATYVSGYEHDTPDDVINIGHFSKEIGCFTIQIYPPAITPGTIDARLKSHLKIPCCPECYMNGHTVVAFPKQMLPSTLQKAVFDAAMVFYDESKPQKRLVRYIYWKIWKGLEVYYNALQQIEAEVLLPEKLYKSNSGGNYMLQEEKLRAIVDDAERYRVFAGEIESIFKYSIPY